jgi:hypothetical protein
VRREASRLAASADVEAARRCDAEAALARERAARADDAAAHADALDTLKAVVASREAEIVQLRMALANRSVAVVAAASGGVADAETRVAEAQVRAARAERALAASRAVETELSALLLAERRREAGQGAGALGSPAASRAAPSSSRHGSLQPRPREGRLSHELLAAALEAQ